MWLTHDTPLRNIVEPLINMFKFKFPFISVVAIDMRGYCESEVLPGIENYSMDKLTGETF